MHGAPINVNGNPTVKHSDWRQEAEGMVGPLILNFFIVKIYLYILYIIYVVYDS